MDNSFHAAMNDLVAADAARMSGPRFANRHGGGVVRRVRTRRTVRAAGIGGGTMLTAGALAVGATHLEWGQLDVASSGSDSTAEPAPATSPFQCGYVFPSASQSVEGMAIEDAGWLTSEEVLARLDRRLNTNFDSSGNPVQSEHVAVPFHVDSTQSLPTFSLVDSAGSAAASGYTGTEDPVLNSPTIDGLQGPAGAEIEVSNEGLTFVAVSESTVIGTITSPLEPEDASPVMWTNTSPQTSLTLVNPEGAFSVCPGATLGNDFDVYAVAGRVTVDSAHVTTGPFYVWSEIAKP